MQQITAGQSTEMNLYGPDTQTGERGGRVLHVVIYHFGTFISLLFTGHAGLNRALPIDQARNYLADVKREAKSGTAVWAIEQLAGAWTSAAAIADQAEQDMVTGINERMDAAQPTPVDVSDILADMPPAGSWNALRRSHSRTAAPTTVAMQRVLDSAVGGYIARSKDADSRQLIALDRRGKVELDWQWIGRERVIVGAWLAGHKPQEVAA